MSNIMPAFDKFPREGAIVGRLLVGYGELELGLCFCVAAARDDFNMVFKAMFRPRGESQRILIADAMGRGPLHQAGVAQPFEEAISAMKLCLKIRNQFAHCYWTDDFGRQLGFVELEDTADKNRTINDVYHIKASDITLAVLEAQEAYFVYTRDLLAHLTSRVKQGARKSPGSVFPAPKTVSRPPLCSP